MEDKHKCPVCGKYEFETYNSLDMCDICLWSDDAVQENDPDYRGGANRMSLNEAREAYKNGEPIMYPVSDSSHRKMAIISKHF